MKMLLRRAPNRADDAQARERRPPASSPRWGPAQRPAGPRRRRPQPSGWLPSRSVPLNSLWWNPGERRERRGARLTRRAREEYRVYFDRNATQKRSEAEWFSRDASPAAPAPGETPTIGFSRPPRQHEKVVRALTLARPGVIGAGFALPRVPTGGRRSRAAGAIWTVGAPARGCIFTATGPPGFHHRPLSEVGLGRAHYCAGHQCSAAKPVVLLAQRGEQTGYRRSLPRRPRSGGRSSSPRMSS